MTVDGAPVPKRHRAGRGRARGRGGRREGPAAAAPRRGAGASRSPSPYEDEHLLVDRQAGRASSCTPRAGHREGTLSQALAGRAAGGEAGRAGIVHRLDKDTSGLLVVARDEATHRALREALARRELVREYLALVEGRPPARTGTIDAPLGRDRASPHRGSAPTPTGRARP